MFSSRYLSDLVLNIYLLVIVPCKYTHFSSGKRFLTLYFQSLLRYYPVSDNEQLNSHCGKNVLLPRSYVVRAFFIQTHLNMGKQFS